jgi:tetratricopeptide (TPR) repeat protein
LAIPSCLTNFWAEQTYIAHFVVSFCWNPVTAFKMSSLADLPELVGFFSYSRDDDEAFQGTLSTLRDAIQRELAAQLGRSKRTFRLWQDQVAIATGKLWESEIKKAVEESVFFIPIITPRAVNSKYCKFEFESFLAREQALGRDDLIFPILYIPVAMLEDESKWREDLVLSTVGARQYVDWRLLRHLDVQTTAVREKIADLCRQIVEALNRQRMSPEERRMEEAKARQQAEEEQKARQLEAEAKWRAEEVERRKEARRRAEEKRKQAESKAREAEARRKATEEAEARSKTEREPPSAQPSPQAPGRLSVTPEQKEQSERVSSERPKAAAVSTAAVSTTDGSDRPYLRKGAVTGVAAAVLVLVGWIALTSTNILMWPPWAGTRAGNDEKTQADAEVKRPVVEATVKAEQERQARGAAEVAAEAKRKADEAEQQAEQERQARAAAEQAAQQQLAALKAEADRKQAQSEAEARYSTLMSQANTYSNNGNYDTAIATFGEAIRLNPNDALAFYSRGLAYGKKGDNDHAIADYNVAIRLDAKNALAFRNRGLAYEKKGNTDQAIADFSEAIRLDPNDALAFNSRGVIYGMKGDYDRAIADFNKGILLDPTRAVAFGNRGLAYVKKGDNNQAIADFDAAIRLNPYDARAFCNRGITKSKIKDKSGDADIAKARQLDAEVCR